MFGIFCQVHNYIMGREVPRQLLVAFRQIQEMQVGFTIGLTFGQSQMQTQFAFSGLLYMQINVQVAKQILLAFWQAVEMQIEIDID